MMVSWWAQRTISLGFSVFYASSNLIQASTSGSISVVLVHGTFRHTCYKKKKRNDISGFEVLRTALGAPEFVCIKLNERIGKIRVLFEKFDYFDDTQCALRILRHCIGAPKPCIVCVVNRPQVQLLNP